MHTKIRSKIKDRDLVEVINEDSTFYGKRGRVVAIKPTKEVIIYEVFLPEIKERISFMQYDLKTIPSREED